MSKTLIIGWDAADWQVLNQLMKEGLMPNFSALLKRSSYGKIATLQPVLSPLLWTSVATGQRAHRHGILGFAEWHVEGARPVSARHRKEPAFWNIFTEAGLKSQVVNWWPSYPTEKIQGQMVSKSFFDEDHSPEAVFPSDMQASLSELIVNAQELGPEVLSPFFPEHSLAQLASDPMVGKVASILAKSISVHNVSTELMQQKDWQVHAVYHEALDHFSHLAMRYFPPQMASVSAEEFKSYRQIISSAYRWHDLMLGRLLELAGPNCDVILLSDHGFQSGVNRPQQLPDLPAAPALEHRSHGVLVMGGPSFKAHSELYGASLLDIVPSLLQLHQLPVAEDMPGKVLGEAFKNEKPISFINSWKELIPSHFSKEEPQKTSPEVLTQLEELGYIDLPRKDLKQHLERDWRYNRCLSLMDEGDFKAAWQEALLEKTPAADPRFVSLLGDLSLRLGEWQYFEELQPLLEPTGPAQVFLKGIYHLQRQEAQEALAEFEKLKELAPHSPQLFTEIARSWYALGKWPQAEEAFDQALKIEKDYSAALGGKAMLAHEQGDWSQALKLAETSLQLAWFQPHVHYIMASCFSKLSHPEAALKALQIALKQAPRHQRAQRLWKELHGKKTDSVPAIIVSGLPRSGTSMMMQILAANGIPVIRDDQRQTDEHNPRGYFEFETVKQLAGGAELPPLEGRALKVVAPLLPFLPAENSYQLIWMDRAIMEVVWSQEKMKAAAEANARNFPFQLAVELEEEQKRWQAWLDRQSNFTWQSFAYENWIDQPEKMIKELGQFLGRKLDQGKTLEAISPSLYRNRLNN